MTFFRTVFVCASLLAAAPLLAQTNINLGAISADPNAPLEITADNLSVDQDTGIAVFEGNVVAGQGQLRISAGRVQVVYDGASREVTRLLASGGVTFVTETDAAEAASAEYDLGAGTLVMRGDVLLTQGASAIAAETMRVNLNDGSAQMEGSVRTIFTQGGN